MDEKTKRRREIVKQATKSFRQERFRRQAEKFEYNPKSVLEKMVFHGTNAPFEGQNIQPSEGGLMGGGVYLTDDPEIAKTYAKSQLTNPRRLREGKIPTTAVKSYMLSPDTKLLDMQSELGEKERGIFNEMIKGWIDEENLPDFEVRPKEKGYSAMKSLQEAIAESEAYTYEGNDSIDELQYRLKEKLGYDGLVHEGGAATGGKRHNVAVMFDPERTGQKKLTAVPSKVKGTTPSGEILPKKLRKKIRWGKYGKQLSGIAKIAGPLAKLASLVGIAASSDPVEASRDFLTDTATFGLVDDIGKGSELSHKDLEDLQREKVRRRLRLIRGQE